MKSQQSVWRKGLGWQPQLGAGEAGHPQWLLVFGGRAFLEDADRCREIREAYPQAAIIGCSTSGEIAGTQVRDETIVVTAIEFEKTRVQTACVRAASMAQSGEAGNRLAQQLDPKGLVHAFVLSDGQCVNGSELVKGLVSRLPQGVAVTGGLAGDGTNFQKTLVWVDGSPQEGVVGIVGLYGDHLKVGYGSLGGWDPFGPDRVITKSRGNVLYELDGQSALGLYKKYLGEHASGLPASGLLFPLVIRPSGAEAEAGVVRTILGVNESEQTMTFAGDLPEGYLARLMKANFDRLIDGAIGAAKASHERIGSASVDLAVLISCVGRKLVLGQRVEEEVEGVRKVLGPKTLLTGFYSYGEISPLTPSAKCELHNQTMTITTFSER